MSLSDARLRQHSTANTAKNAAPPNHNHAAAMPAHAPCRRATPEQQHADEAEDDGGDAAVGTPCETIDPVVHALHGSSAQGVLETSNRVPSSSCRVCDESPFAVTRESGVLLSETHRLSNRTTVAQGRKTWWSAARKSARRSRMTCDTRNPASAAVKGACSAPRPPIGRSRQAYAGGPRDCCRMRIAASQGVRHRR
jgi:hypothetical protein